MEYIFIIGITLLLTGLIALLFGIILGIMKADKEITLLPLQEVADERNRQISGEGYAIEHDDEHEGGELAMAAATYITPPNLRGDTWPWHPIWWKTTPQDRKRELVKGIALALSELERLHRKEREGEK